MYIQIAHWILHLVLVISVFGTYRFMRDGLTGLWVRRVYEVLYRIGYYARLHMPVYVAFIDIDDFKFFNTTYGHSGGDAVLRSVAKVVKAHSGRKSYSCRYGGDEYCVMFFGYDDRTVVAICNELLERIRSIDLALVNISNRSPEGVNITATISIAEREQYARLLERLSKTGGKNRVITPAENKEREKPR